MFNRSSCVIAVVFYLTLGLGRLEAAIESRGGSNLAFYASNPDGSFPGCYGVLKNFHRPNVRSIVEGQLDQMKANGQEKLRILVWHASSPDNTHYCSEDATGYYMDSTGGDFDLIYKENLRDLMTLAANKGFFEIVVAFAPLGDNHPGGWGGVERESISRQLEPNRKPSPLHFGVGRLLSD